MQKLKISEGDRFGRLTVIRELPIRIKPNGQHYRVLLLKCDCGNEKIVPLGHLKSGHTKSCGCLNKEFLSNLSYSHGKTGTRLYRTWAYIKSRCYNPNVAAYPDYGGRGIIMYKEWLNNPLMFIEYCKTLENWDDESLSIDRIDNNGNYEPNNIRFTTQEIQCRNKRVNIQNKTGFAGVTIEVMPSGNIRYRASIGLNHKKVQLGSFKSAELAYQARCNYIQENNIKGYKI